MLILQKFKFPQFIEKIDISVYTYIMNHRNIVTEFITVFELCSLKLPGRSQIGFYSCTIWLQLRERIIINSFRQN